MDAPGPSERRLRSLYVHGFFPRPERSTPVGWEYWTLDVGRAPPGIEPIAVNYDSFRRIADENHVVRAVFDLSCTGADECYVACHDLGCAHVGYALANHARTSGWNVRWVLAAGSAEGGTELAGALQSLYPPAASLRDLVPSATRALWNHDQTADVQIYMLAASGCLNCEGRAVLPGRDDGFVAYHSAIGAREPRAYCNDRRVERDPVTGTTRCTTGDCLCDGHPDGLAAPRASLYDNRVLFFYDVDEAYFHEVALPTGGHGPQSIVGAKLLPLMAMCAIDGDEVPEGCPGAP